MTYPIASAIASFVICFLVMPLIIKYSFKTNIVDIPGKRKVHKKITPSMGGIAIFLAFLFSSLIWIEIEHWGEVRIVLIALMMTFFIGVRDDLVPIRPITKIMGQVIASMILILIYDLRLTSMYGILGIYEIPLWASYGVTVFTLIVITNSFNLIDGLDGLAATVASVALLCFGTWYFLVGDLIFSILSFSMLGALIAFLLFNWEPSKVFMGDTGAMVTGMMLAITTIHFIDINDALPPGHKFRFTPTVTAAICFIIIPLIDTLRIVIIRLMHKKSPFSPDKSHVHHSIMRLGFSHSATTKILALTHIIFIGIAIVFRNISDNYLLPGVILLSVVLSVLLNWLIRGRVSNHR